MKKIFVLLCISCFALVTFSCEKKCVCKGTHPSGITEVHDYGKMKKKECNDQQNSMNSENTVYTWKCGS